MQNAHSTTACSAASYFDYEKESGRSLIYITVILLCKYIFLTFLIIKVLHYDLHRSSSEKSQKKIFYTKNNLNCNYPTLGKFTC